MNFADHYYSKHSLYPALIKENTSCNLFLSIVIPCHNEPDLLISLNSLWQCDRPKCDVEVIVVINAAIDANQSVIDANIDTLEKTNNWILNHQDSKLRFYVLYFDNFNSKDAGVGLARKIGMDEAARRLISIDKHRGVITGFDADSICERNYLVEVENYFQNHPKINASSIYFEHPLTGDNYGSLIYGGIIQYELYLRFYMQSLRWAGHPYSFHTVGSSFAVRADVYMKQGGMNKRKAGEDFYFLQKVIPLENYGELNTTKVIPSPRPSDRVPFGTGATIQKMITLSSSELTTYNFDAFVDLKLFFSRFDELYRITQIYYLEFLDKLPNPIKLFCEETNFWGEIELANQNTADLNSFKSRLFKAFNAFKVLKYLNYSHEHWYKQLPIVESAYSYLKTTGVCETEDISAESLLLIYRKLER